MVADDAEIVNQGMYIFGTEVIVENWFEHLVDLEVIRQRSEIHSTTTDIRINFDSALQKRDPVCVFTAYPPGFCEGLHIIPFARGTNWLDVLISGRLLDADRATQPTDINDIRNGLLMTRNFYGFFDTRQLVVMKSPNKILSIEDIPDAPARIINEKCSFPQNVRFTAQWLVSDPELELGLVNNTDTAFRKWSRSNLFPSELFLDYNYGAAAVKLWGRGRHTLVDHVFQRPPKAIPITRPAFKEIDSEARAELAMKRDPSVPTEYMQYGDAEELDEDDILIVFAASTPAARARRERDHRKLAESVQHWTRSVAECSIDTSQRI